MKKTEHAWVIQRKDGMYCFNSLAWVKKLYNACMIETLEDCEFVIKKMNLQNCKPVKVEISIVGEDNE